jgi:hypothetical protein
MPLLVLLVPITPTKTLKVKDLAKVVVKTLTPLHPDQIVA